MNKIFSALELFEVSCLLMKPAFGFSNPDVIFLAGRAKNDAAPLLQQARFHLRANVPVCIPGHDGSYTPEGVRVETGYPGFQAWKNHLNHNLLCAGLIYSCVVRPGHETITHTREESDGFVLRAKEEGWKNAYVLAHAHQIPRLMCCLLKSCSDFSYPMALRPLFCQETRWNESVYGSLGLVEKPRWQHIEEEFSRLLTYTQQGWAVSLSELKQYLLNPKPLT